MLITEVYKDTGTGISPSFFQLKMVKVRTVKPAAGPSETSLLGTATVRGRHKQQPITHECTWNHTIYTHRMMKLTCLTLSRFGILAVFA